MRNVAISAVALLSMYGSALALDDGAVCSNLRSMGASGLYLAYPSYSPAVLKLGAQNTCGADGVCLIKAARNNLFDDNVRFYYVTTSIPRTEEGVWHIRTQTRARNLDGADQAYLARPAITTRCSPNAPLEAFFGGAGYVSVNDYIDHHADDGWRLSRDVGLKFHFRIQDPPGGPACVATDDRRVFKNQSSIYGFDDVARKQKRVARLLNFVGTAEAATPYAGLSSEFAYFDRPDVPCFGFAGPKPTRSEYLGQSINWQPYQTTIWIKRLRGHDITLVGGQAVSLSWNP